VILVPEGRHLLPKLTVEENLYLGALRQQARPHIRRNLEASYDLLRRIDYFAPTSQISRKELQNLITVERTLTSVDPSFTPDRLAMPGITELVD